MAQREKLCFSCGYLRTLSRSQAATPPEPPVWTESPVRGAKGKWRSRTRVKCKSLRRRSPGPGTRICLLRLPRSNAPFSKGATDEVISGSEILKPLSQRVLGLLLSWCSLMAAFPITTPALVLSLRSLEIRAPGWSLKAKGVCVLSRFRRVWLFATPWAVARQVPLPMDFSRQECWSGLPFPSPRDLPYWTGVSYVSCIGRQVLYRWQYMGSPCFTPHALRQRVLSIWEEGTAAQDSLGPGWALPRGCWKPHHRQKQGQPLFTRMFYLLPFFKNLKYNWHTVKCTYIFIKICPHLPSTQVKLIDLPQDPRNSFDAHPAIKRLESSQQSFLPQS